MSSETLRPGGAPPAGRYHSDIDPITFSVILGRFNSIAHEMTLTLEYTAWTSILALARDYSCAIYDARPRQICMFDALPIHTTSLHLVLREIAEAFAGSISEGDVFFCNDPYRNNTHTGDVVTAAPVFVDGRHLFWSVTRGHQLDVGAAIPSSLSSFSKDIWQEGLHIPPMKLFDRGEARSDVLEMYLANVRYQDLLKGDLLAQLGSIEKGRLRLIDLAQDYGSDQVMRYVDAIIDYADRRMSQAVEAMPDGIFEAEGWVDTDAGERTNIPIRVRIEVSGDQISIDYTGSGAQSPTGVNSSFATSQAGPAIPFMYYIEPDIPHNYGCFKHIKIYAPEGTICNATYPHSTSMATICPTDLMQDVVNMAMAQAIPERVVAGSARCSNLPNFSGEDPTTGKAWAVHLFNGAGGGGASSGTDGWPLMTTLGALGGVKALMVEQVELMHPMLHVERMEIEMDSMGFGEWIGGPGVRFVVRPVGGAVECVTWGDGFENPPHGVLGGTMAIGGGQYIEDIETGKRRFLSAPAYLRVEEGERRVGVSTGGGGYGSPVRRDAESVRIDVRDGFVSGQAAREVFGVVVTDAFDPEIDVGATRMLRDELSKADRPFLEPTRPGTGSWTSANMRPGDEYVLNPVLR